MFKCLVLLFVIQGVLRLTERIVFGMEILAVALVTKNTDLVYLAHFYFQMYNRTKEEQAKCL